MATVSASNSSPPISSPGIGSGLDINGIVTKLVALEKQPLQRLQQSASLLQGKMSSVGQIKSQMASLSDALTNLASVTGWNNQSVSNSNPAAINAAVESTAASGSYTINVTQLAKSQSVVSAPLSMPLPEGQLTIDVGSMSQGNYSPRGSAVVVSLSSADDTLDKVAAKINASGASITAVVLRDSNGQRLLMRSNVTGADAVFRVRADAGLEALSFDPQTNGYGSSSSNNTASTNPATSQTTQPPTPPAVNTGGLPIGVPIVTPPDGASNNTSNTGSPSSGSTASSSGMRLVQAGQNVVATINGVQVDSSTNEYTGLTGMTLQFRQVTTSPVELSVGRDTDTVKDAVTSMVNAYNALSTTLVGLVKYDAGSKTAGPFQGDSTVTSIQFALRRMIGAAGPDGQKRLSDLGVKLGTDGKLSVNDSQLNVALTTHWSSTKDFFSNSSHGFAVKLKAFAEGLLNTRGALTSKTESLQSLLNKNNKDQDAVNNRAARVETDLRRQYNALDARLGQLGALNNYVTQQISAWNKKDN